MTLALLLAPELLLVRFLELLLVLLLELLLVLLQRLLLIQQLEHLPRHQLKEEHHKLVQRLQLVQLEVVHHK